MKGETELAEDLILSIHVPKTAGITVRALLEERFGNAVYGKYSDRDSLSEHRGTVRVIHGHFRVAEFLDRVERPRVMTFLRDPLARAVSHFYYWLDPEARPLADNPVRKKYFESMEPSLERFILAPELANRASSLLDPLVDPDDFWFVGLFEDFVRDCGRLREQLGLPGREEPVLNRTPRPAEVKLSQDVISEFEDLNRRDMELYRRVCASREFHGLSGALGREASIPGSTSDGAHPPGGDEAAQAVRLLEMRCQKLETDLRSARQMLRAIESSRSWRAMSTVKRISKRVRQIGIRG